MPENERMIVYRLIQNIGVKSPGLVFLIPVIDLGKKVSLQELESDLE